MTHPEHPTAPAERDRVIEALCQHYAGDNLEMEEFERRVDRAHQARTQEELQALLADLPAVTDASVAASPGAKPESRSVPAVRPDTQSPAAVRERATEVAIWSARERKGSWRPAQSTRAFAAMGAVELDFREAVLPPGETHVHAIALMGAVDVTVPPGVRVETDGFAIMGAFEEHAEDSNPADDAPVIRITGFAFMGSVEVKCRYPGESARQARRRRKEEAKRLKRGGGPVFLARTTPRRRKEEGKHLGGENR